VVFSPFWSLAGVREECSDGGIPLILSEMVVAMAAVAINLFCIILAPFFYEER
jgi:hypothetical protein